MLNVWDYRRTRHLIAGAIGLAVFVFQVGSAFAILGKFERIIEGGVEGPRNNYAHSLTYLKHPTLGKCLIIGSTGHWAWNVGQSIPTPDGDGGDGGDGGGLPDLEIRPITIPADVESVVDFGSSVAGSETWANDMAPSIYRWCYGQETAEKVYTSPVFALGEGLHAPLGPGWRSGNTYSAIHEGEEKTAAYHGIGFGYAPGFSMGHIVRSFTGDPGSWEIVPTPASMGADATTIHTWKDRLCVANTGVVAPFGVGASVHCTTKKDANGNYAHPTSADDWELVANVTLSAATLHPEAGFQFSAFSFQPASDFFYVGTAAGPPGAAGGGAQIWKCSEPTTSIPIGGNCTPIILYGAGDQRNGIWAELEIKGKHIYAGGFNLPTSLEQFQDLKAAEIVRINIETDEWDLVVGDCVAKIPAPDGSGFDGPRRPISGLPAGFGVSTNVYTTALEEHNFMIYAGTFDLASFFVGMPSLPTLNDGGCFGDLGGGISQLSLPIHPGADIWKSYDGRFWMSVTKDGFGEPTNMWPRTMLSVGTGFQRTLFIGFANPFKGFEVFKNGGFGEISSKWRRR